MELNREQIIKALECCAEAKNHADCIRLNCPALINDECYYTDDTDEECNRKQFADALTLIKELIEENERLRSFRSETEEGAIKILKKLDVLEDEVKKLIKENEELNASCTELTRKLKCANLEIECKERICESYMLQYGTVVDKEVWLKKERADTVRKMQAEIEARCIKGGIYPAFVKSTIDQIAKEIFEEGTANGDKEN